MRCGTLRVGSTLRATLQSTATDRCFQHLPGGCKASEAVVNHHEFVMEAMCQIGHIEPGYSIISLGERLQAWPRRNPRFPPLRSMTISNRMYSSAVLELSSPPGAGIVCRPLQQPVSCEDRDGFDRFSWRNAHGNN
jgi:hypothetical protein